MPAVQQWIRSTEPPGDHTYENGNNPGWSGGAKVLGKLPVPGRPTILITVGQGPTALAVGAGGGCVDIFSLIYPFSSLSPSLWEAVRYRLKYCLKGPLNPRQPTNQRKQLSVLVRMLHFFRRDRSLDWNFCS